MSRRTSEQAFATAASGMVHAVPVGDILFRLVRDCVDVVRAESAAILVLDADHTLNLLASSSSAATQLELLQALDEVGPCVDVIESGRVQTATGAEMTRRWGDVGRAIAEAGFGSVHAFPLIWHGRVLGGLNVFGGGRGDDVMNRQGLCQAFADVATIVIVHGTDIAADELTARVHRATAARRLVEQAKGVLSELEHLDMEAAASRLEEVAIEAGTSMSEAAETVIDRAVSRHDQDRPGPGVRS